MLDDYLFVSCHGQEDLLAFGCQHLVHALGVIHDDWGVHALCLANSVDNIQASIDLASRVHIGIGGAVHGAYAGQFLATVQLSGHE